MRRIKARTFIHLVYATLWITLKEIEAETGSLRAKEEAPPRLPYWDPKPKQDYRRIGVKETYYFHPINEVIRKRSYLRDKPMEPNIHWFSQERVDKTDAGINAVQSQNQNYNDSSFGSNRKHIKVRQGAEGEGEGRSTRIAPLHLMQQEGEKSDKKPEVEKPTTEKQKKIKKDDDNDLFGDLIPLSPYSIKMQLGEILASFDDVEYTVEVIGRTASYLDIMLFKLSERGNRYFRTQDNKYVENDSMEKKIVFIVHALSPMGLGNLFSLTLESHLKILLSYYVAHLNKFDIYWIPMANPDGYIRAKSVTYWNKNVSPNTACPGVDVDRNFDVAWNNTHQEESSCSQHFPGVTPFSEPESRAVRDIFHRVSHKIVAYIHVHGGTYTSSTFKGDAVLYPKGYTDRQTDDDKYIDLKGEIDEAIKNANFKVLSVTVDTLYNWYGKVTGTSVDYAATVYGIPYAMEFVMQLYQDAFDTQYQKVDGVFNITSMEYYSLAEIWKRVIDTTFTSIHKKLVAHESET